MQQFDAVVTKKQVSWVNDAMRKHARSWRIAFVLLTMDSERFLKFCNECDDEMLDTLLDAIPACRELFIAMADDMQTAICRLVACCEERERLLKAGQ